MAATATASTPQPLRTSTIPNHSPQSPPLPPPPPPPLPAASTLVAPSAQPCASPVAIGKARLLWRGSLRLRDGTLLPGVCIVSSLAPAFGSTRSPTHLARAEGAAAEAADDDVDDDATAAAAARKREHDAELDVCLTLETLRHAPLGIARAVDTRDDPTLEAGPSQPSSSSAASKRRDLVDAVGARPELASRGATARAATCVEYRATGNTRLYVDPRESPTVAFFERHFCYPSARDDGDDDDEAGVPAVDAPRARRAPRLGAAPRRSRHALLLEAGGGGPAWSGRPTDPGTAASTWRGDDAFSGPGGGAQELAVWATWDAAGGADEGAGETRRARLVVGRRVVVVRRTARSGPHAATTTAALGEAGPATRGGPRGGAPAARPKPIGAPRPDDPAPRTARPAPSLRRSATTAAEVACVFGGASGRPTGGGGGSGGGGAVGGSGGSSFSLALSRGGARRRVGPAPPRLVKARSTPDLGGASGASSSLTPVKEVDDADAEAEGEAESVGAVVGSHVGGAVEAMVGSADEPGASAAPGAAAAAAAAAAEWEAEAGPLPRRRASAGNHTPGRSGEKRRRRDESPPPPPSPTGEGEARGGRPPDDAGRAADERRAAGLEAPRAKREEASVASSVAESIWAPPSPTRAMPSSAAAATRSTAVKAEEEEEEGATTKTTATKTATAAAAVEARNRAAVKKLAHYQLLGRGVERGCDEYHACYAAACNGTLVALRHTIATAPLDRARAARVVAAHLDLYLPSPASSSSSSSAAGSGEARASGAS